MNPAVFVKIFIFQKRVLFPIWQLTNTKKWDTINKNWPLIFINRVSRTEKLCRQCRYYWWMTLQNIQECYIIIKKGWQCKAGREWCRYTLNNGPISTKTPVWPLWKKHSLQANMFRCSWFQFIYIYKSFKIMWRPTYFLKKNWQSEKIVQVKRTNAPYLLLFFVVKTLIAIVYRPQEKNMQITLNPLWIFIIIHHFCMATFKSQHMGRWKT